MLVFGGVFENKPSKRIPQMVVVKNGSESPRVYTPETEKIHGVWTN